MKDGMTFVSADSAQVAAGASVPVSGEQETSRCPKCASKLSDNGECEYCARNSSHAGPNLRDIRLAARLLIAKGYQPLPLPDGQKRPLLNGWQTVAISDAQVDEFFTEGCNIGLRLDKVTDVDLDCPEARALAPFFLESTGARWGRKTSPRSHHLYHVKNSRFEEFLDPMFDRKVMVVEIRHDHGHQTMIPPSVHPETGELLEWDGVGINGAVHVTFDSLHRAVGKIAAGAMLMRYALKNSGARQNIWLYLSGAMARAEWTKEEALHFCASVTQAVRDEEPDARQSAVEASYEKDKGDEQVAGLKRLEEYLDKKLVRKIAIWLRLRRTTFDSHDLSDDANANSIFVEHGEDFRHLPTEGKGGLWLYWNDVVWQRDRLSYVHHLGASCLKRKAEQLIASSRDGRFIKDVRSELLNVPGVNGALKRLSWFPEIVATSGTFDSNPWLIGLQNGIYNLQLGRLEEGAREQFVSRQMQASYDPEATCPRWLVCLKRAQPDVNIRACLQRLAGSVLIGMQTEHGFIFNHGKGANFKTAYSEVLRRVMGGDYAAFLTKSYSSRGIKRSRATTSRTSMA